MKLTRNYKYKIALILSAFLFGTTFLVVKNLLTTMTSSNIVFWRYVLASILFLIAGGIPNKETSKDAYPWAFSCGLVTYSKLRGWLQPQLLTQAS